MRIGRKGKNLQRFVQKMDQLDFAANCLFARRAAALS
jgi:hypothetical protein